MAKFTPHTQGDIKDMLSAVGKKGTSQLLVSLPEDYYIPENKWPDGLSESEAYQQINGLAIRNRAPECTFTGAGIYNHYIPVGVRKLFNSERLLNAPSIYKNPSQILLQGVFECQKMLSNLIGMPTVSLCATDAAVALAHACLSLKREGKNKLMISTLVKPNLKKVLDCYLQPHGIVVNYVDALGSKISMESLTAHLTEEVFAVYVEQPNFYGSIEDMQKITELVHSAGIKLIVGVNPISLMLLKKPSEYGADIAVGDCQSLGLPISHGSNTMGFMACAEEYSEGLLGDVVVSERDGDGNDFYRVKRVNGITTEIDARKAVIVGAYLAHLGSEGLKRVAVASVSNAHYLKFELAKAGIGVKYKDEYFNEFVTLSKCSSESILTALAQEGITGGHKISTHEILWCTTELHTREQMDRCAEICGGVNQ